MEFLLGGRIKNHLSALLLLVAPSVSLAGADSAAPVAYVQAASACPMPELYSSAAPSSVSSEPLSALYAAAKRGDLRSYLSFFSSDGSRQSKEEKLRSDADLVGLYKNLTSVECLFKIDINDSMVFYEITHVGKISVPDRTDGVPISIPVPLIKVCDKDECKFSNQIYDQAAIRAFAHLVRDGKIKIARPGTKGSSRTAGALMGKLPMFRGRTDSAIQIYIPVEKLDLNNQKFRGLTEIRPSVGLDGDYRIQSKYGDKPSRLMGDNIRAIGRDGLPVKIIGRLSLAKNDAHWHVVGIVDAFSLTAPQILPVDCSHGDCTLSASGAEGDVSDFLRSFIVESRVD